MNFSFATCINSAVDGADTRASSPLWVLGIDVGKRHVDAALQSPEQRAAKSLPQARFDNSLEGQERLQAWVRKRLPAGAKLHVCMEATGPYWQRLAACLHTWAEQVSVVNPRTVKAFGVAQMCRSKSDRADARLIAAYTRAMDPAPWSPPSAQQAELAALQRRLDSLKGQRTAESNRLESALPKVVLQDIKSHLRLLDRRIAKMEAALLALIHADPVQARTHQLLMSIPGIGQRTAAGLQCELADVAAYHSARQLAAHAGLTPRHRQSGQRSGRTTISKIGSARLRGRLYMSAMAAGKHSAPFIAFAHRLRRNAEQRHSHLCEKSILCAIMRKMLHIVYGVLKHQKPFNPSLMLNC
jgi:transposase